MQCSHVFQTTSEQGVMSDLLSDLSIARHCCVYPQSSAYYHGYVLAEMSVHQTRAHFKAKYGSLADNPAIGKDLTEVRDQMMLAQRTLEPWIMLYPFVCKYVDIPYVCVNVQPRCLQIAVLVQNLCNSPGGLRL